MRRLRSRLNSQRSTMRTAASTLALSRGRCENGFETLEAEIHLFLPIFSRLASKRRPVCLLLGNIGDHDVASIGKCSGTALQRLCYGGLANRVRSKNGREATMNEPSITVLQQLEPEGLDAEGQNWQRRKSVQTRLAILEAAIDCLQEHGFARTTTQLIAKMAGISRGAMLHHYATKQNLIASVIEYIFYRRMENFVAAIGTLSEDERVDRNAGIEIYWQSLLTREFAAFLELMVAARTDAELREVFLPRARHYEKIERTEVARAFPEWQDNRAAYDLAMDFCVSAMQGLLLHREIWDERDRRVRLRQFISTTVVMLRSGVIKAL
jgi:AcrR family transcriptional regulator